MKTFRPSLTIPLFLFALAASTQGAEKFPRVKSGDTYPLRYLNREDGWKTNAAVDLDHVRNAAERINGATRAYWAKNKITPRPQADDDAFVRRVHLDLVGRIPTPDEVRVYRAWGGEGKRLMIAVGLVQTESWVDNFYNLWAGLLRVTTQNPNNGMPAKAYENWVKNALRENMPYDEFARQLITADGQASAENGAVGFVLRDQQQGFLDHFSQLSTIFLASQVGCAMCHNAKFEPVTQKQFYQMAAYFSEINLSKNPENLKKLREEEKATGKTAKEIAEIRRKMREEPFIVTDVKGRELKLPPNYKYDASEAGKAVAPEVLFGHTVTAYPGESRRETFARWMTSPENPNFTKTVANRLWKRIFGIGLIEPANDVNPENKPLSPELMDTLVKVMVDLGYNMKEFTAALAASDLYQRATIDESITHENWKLDGVPLRRLSAEQLWDSMVTLVMGETIRQRSVATASVSSGATYVSGPAMSGMPMPPPMMAGSMPMAMTAGGGEMAPSMMMEEGKKNPKKGAAQMGPNIPLASEQYSPIRAGSFLDQFGMPQREVISEGSSEPNLIQALYMMNSGEVMRATVPNPNHRLFNDLKALGEPEAMVNEIWLRLFARAPSSAEKEKALSYLKQVGIRGGAVVDLVWALVNNREFLFYM